MMLWKNMRKNGVEFSVARVKCPNCSYRRLVMSPLHAGMKVHCPQCGKAFVITAKMVKL